MSPAPSPLPGWFWDWARWKDAGSPRGKRPRGAPRRIPAWAWERYAQHLGAGGPSRTGAGIGSSRGEVLSPPPPAPSVFAGTGAFTAWEPAAALRLRGLADWVAVQLDPEGGQVPGLSGVGPVYGWQARAWEPVATYWLKAYIGQAETQAELDACLALVTSGPKALVGNPSAWSEDGLARARSQGWELLLEWYQNAQPWLSFDRLDSRGYPVSSFVLGCYDASGESSYGRRVPLADYLEQMPKGTSWSVYLAETLTDDDVEAWRRWKQG